MRFHPLGVFPQVAEEIWICEKQKVTKWEGDIIDYKEHLKAQVMHDSKTSTWLGNKTHSLLTSLREVTGSTSSGNIKKDATAGQSAAASGVNNHGATRRDASGYLSKSQSRESVQRKDSRETS